jgi:hypothetical protein
MMPLYKLFFVARQVPQNWHTINEKGSWAHCGLKMLHDFVDTDNFRIVESCWRRLSIGYPKNDGRRKPSSTILYKICTERLRKDIPHCVLLVVLGIIQDIQYKFPRILVLHMFICMCCLWLEMGMHRFAKASELVTGSRDNAHPI